MRREALSQGREPSDTHRAASRVYKKGVLRGLRTPGLNEVAGQRYLWRIDSLAPKVLKHILRGEELTRNAITKVELSVQDFLRAVLLPFVGQWDVPDYIANEDRRAFQTLESLAGEVQREEKEINFIGAHYRSRLSIRGRRSAFASRTEVFNGCLKEFLGDRLEDSLGELPEIPTFRQLWDAIYLEQYFRLFGVGATFSEWALRRERLRPVAVLTSRKAKNCSMTTRALIGDIEVSALEVSASLTRELWPPTATRQLWRTVAKAIAETRVEEGSDFESMERFSEQSPSDQMVKSWLRLMHRANTLASRNLESVRLRAELTERASYVKGLILYGKEYRQFRDELLKDFEPSSSSRRRLEITETAIEQIGQLVSVLQSLRFYQDCYGDCCITIPQELKYFHRKIDVEKGRAVRPVVDPGSQCSVTLFWRFADSLPANLPTILGGAPSLLNHALNEAERRIYPQARSVEPEEPLSPLAYRLEKETGDAHLSASAILKVLSVSEDLSRCLYEGRPRAFTFLLGSPQWLISDLLIEHELIGASRPFRLPSRKKQSAYQTTVALLEGNSSFLQSEDLALFVAWPGEPLEVTHIVRLPRLAASRRKLLSWFTADRPGLLAVVTHGNGRGEAIYKGKVRGILRDGRPWKVEPPNFEDFEDRVLRRLLNIVGRNKESVLSRVLQPAVRELSEEAGVGALFVLAKEDDIKRLRDSSSRLTEVLDPLEGQLLNEISPEVLYQLARDDGAVLICADTLRVWGRRHVLTSVLPDLEESWTRRGPMFWDGWYKTKKWGTRRRTALAVSYELEDRGAVIVVSADGPIDVLIGGRGVEEYRE